MLTLGHRPKQFAEEVGYIGVGGKKTHTHDVSDTQDTQVGQ